MGASLNHDLSAMIIDKPTNEIFYYGNLGKNLLSENGTVNLKLPDNFDSSKHKLVMFTETLNGNNSTDFASEMVEINSSII